MKPYWSDDQVTLYLGDCDAVSYSEPALQSVIPGDRFARFSAGLVAWRADYVRTGGSA